MKSLSFRPPKCVASASPKIIAKASRPSSKSGSRRSRAADMGTTTVEYRLLPGTRAAVGHTGGHSVIADRPQGTAGGMGLGFNGGELLGLAIGGCFCNDLQSIADEIGAEIAELKVTVSV